MTPQQLERAGDFVLGLMDRAERAAFELEMAGNAELAAAVQKLQTRLMALDDTAQPLAPSAGLWSSIEKQLNAPSAANDVKAPDTFAQFMRLRPIPSLRTFAIAASVTVTFALGFLAGNMGAAPRKPVMIAVLVNQTDASPGAIVEAFADDSVRLVPLDRFEIPDGQILQVWTLPDVQTGPVSLGTFSDPTAIRLAGPNLPPPESGQLYEITLEPAPGSPTGRPTGPILVKGFAKPPL